MQSVFSAEDSGRVLKYDAATKETTVLLRNLQFPNGVSLSKDRTFFVFSDGAAGRSLQIPSLVACLILLDMNIQSTSMVLFREKRRNLIVTTQ